MEKQFAEIWIEKYLSGKRTIYRNLGGNGTSPNSFTA